MKFDFYLSEMSVSDLHGGGLTLHRVLGDDLNDIDYFIHVNRFATDIPVSNQFAGRVIDLHSIWDADRVRKVIGRTASAKIGRLPLMLKLHAKKAAVAINQKFNNSDTLTALVCPQGANALLVLNELQKLRSVKYVTWIMDDHLLQFKNGSFVYAANTEAIYADHLRKASQVFVISPAMQQFYKARFNVDAKVLFGSSDTIAESAKNIEKKAGSIKIGYFGAVASWQHDALAAIVSAIKHSGNQLHIYSGVMQLPVDLQGPGVEFMGSIPNTEVLATIRNYDAVLLPISFQAELRNMSQFNIATKMSEYLASGVPILAVGPSYAAMINYLDQHQSAITVTSTSPAEINKAIKLLHDANLVSRILSNAQHLVNTEVGTLPMRKKWLSVTKK